MRQADRDRKETLDEDLDGGEWMQVREKDQGRLHVMGNGAILQLSEPTNSDVMQHILLTAAMSGFIK